jgi:4-aminobutyrate aminotransferase-like enzyme
MREIVWPEDESADPPPVPRAVLQHHPFIVDRPEGWVIDIEGRRYLDLALGIGVLAAEHASTADVR